MELSTWQRNAILQTVRSSPIIFIRWVEDEFFSLSNKPIIKEENLKRRSEYSNKEIAYQTRTRKINKIFSFWVSWFILFECLIVSLQYMGVAFRLSEHWHSSIWDIIDYINFLNWRFNEIYYLILVLIIIGLNIPILTVILLLILFKCIKVRNDNNISIILLIILIFPFLMSFGIFSIPTMKLLLETYDWRLNEEGVRVLRRNSSIEWESLEQISLFAVAMITMLLQMISSLVFTSFTHKDGCFDEYGNKVHIKHDSDRIELNESEKSTFSDDSSSSIIKFLWRRKRFKRGIRYVPVILYILQVILLSITIYLPKNEWWPPLICYVVIAWIIIYFIIKQPYSDSRYNHFATALLFHNFFTFFRSFLL